MMAAVVATNRQWTGLFEKNRPINPSFERLEEAREISLPICIGINAFEGLIGVPESQKPEYQVCVSLFDLSFQQFFGRQWIGPYMQFPSNQKKSKLKYNQNVYFHTSLHNPNIVVVVEVSATCVADDTGKRKKVGCGWTIIRPFAEDLPDSRRTNTLPSKKVQMFHGSPRALYFMDEPIEENSHLRKIDACELTFSICTHKALYSVLNLIPENAMVGNNDLIPGLAGSQTPGNNALKKPKHLRKINLQLKSLQIQLNPTLEKFEEELCELLHKDRTVREGRESSGTQVSVVERRLLVGVHNGYTFLEKPETFYLETANLDNKGRSLKPTASPSLRRSKKFSQTATKTTTEGTGSYLVLKNKIQVPEMLEDPMVGVTFSLEYVIGEPLSDEDRKLSSRMSRGNTRTVTIRWATWSPFLQPQGPEIQLAFTGGPVPGPDEEFVYKLPNTQMTNELASQTAGGLLYFQWSSVDQVAGFDPSASGMLAPGSMASMHSGGSDMLQDSANTGRRPPSGRSPSQTQHSAIQQPIPSARKISLIPSASAPEVMMSSRHDMQPGVSLQVPQMMPQPMMHQPAMAPPFVQQQGYPMGYSQQPMPYMQPQPYGFSQSLEITHMREIGGVSSSTDLHELPYTPVHAPIIMQPQIGDRSQGLSRAAYARLYNAGFPTILDRNSEPPEVIDPQKTHEVDLTKESNDPLQCNEIIFQFLAFSRITGLDEISSKKSAGTVFFTFQFYRCPQVTTDRLLLSKPDSDLTSDRSAVPYILQRLEPDGTVAECPPGYEVKYYMDPMNMKTGENELFMRHLSQQRLHIDVWDGDSLLLMGSCAVDLQFLCRGGLEAVQTTFETDVVTTEFENDPDIISSNMSGRGPQPVGIKTVIKGKLHVRIANIGHLVDPKEAIKARLTGSSAHLVISQTAANKGAYAGGRLSGPITNKSQKSEISAVKKIARAHHLAEKNNEVKSLLFSHKDQMVPEKEKNEEDGSNERHRKIARLHAVRQKEGYDHKIDTIMSYKTEKSERMRDYKTLEIYRLQTKKDGILNMLSQTITSEHTIHPSFGSAEFFEFKFKNPFNEQQTVTIEFADDDLHIVTDPREWRYFKQLFMMEGPIEEGMFNKEAKSHHVEIFLRPKETVNIPFKYQTFVADESVKPQGPVDPFKAPEKPLKKQKDHLQTKHIKVAFKSQDGKPVSLLDLTVEPQPHVVDQTLRFYYPEQSFFKKSIRLATMPSLPGAPVGGQGSQELFIKCSNSNVIANSKATQPGEPVDVFVKVALGPSPQIKRFFLALYLDQFMARPLYVWQLYIHALQRVDVSAVEGQTSRFSLLLRGTQSSRLVKCFSSHPEELQLAPSDQFMLAAGAVHELSVAVRPMKEGTKFFYINVVDVEYHQLIRTWLVCSACRSPIISRSFDLSLPAGGGKGTSKRINYTNPYPHKKVFSLLTNRDDLLQFKETTIEVEGGSTHPIGFSFTPVTRPGTATILVFINDEEDKNEETFQINATYQ